MIHRPHLKRSSNQHVGTWPGLPVAQTHSSIRDTARDLHDCIVQLPVAALSPPGQQGQRAQTDSPRCYISRLVIGHNAPCLAAAGPILDLCGPSSPRNPRSLDWKPYPSPNCSPIMQVTRMHLAHRPVVCVLSSIVPHVGLSKHELCCRLTDSLVRTGCRPVRCRPCQRLSYERSFAKQSYGNNSNPLPLCFIIHAPSRLACCRQLEHAMQGTQVSMWMVFVIVFLISCKRSRVPKLGSALQSPIRDGAYEPMARRLIGQPVTGPRQRQAAHPFVRTPRHQYSGPEAPTNI